MILLLENKTLKKYRTIWEEDYDKYINLINSDSFNKYETKMDSGILKYSSRFDIVESNKIKRVLNDNFASKGRGGEYKDGLPSPSVIGDTLFPIDFKKDIFKLKWLNNVDLEDFKNNEKHAKESMSLGTYIHRILELWLIDKRPYYDRDFESLIEIARKDKKLFNTDIDIMEYESIARDTLPDFIKKVLYRYDCLGSEVFFRNNLFQGTIDLIAKADNDYYIIDFKTTRRTHKSGTRKFSNLNDIEPYKRQLCCYYMAMRKDNIILPNDNVYFKIAQFHLVSKEYKILDVPSNDILEYVDSINKVIDWYWSKI